MSSGNQFGVKRINASDFLITSDISLHQGSIRTISAHDSLIITGSSDCTLKVSHSYISNLKSLRLPTLIHAT